MLLPTGFGQIAAISVSSAFLRFLACEEYSVKWEWRACRTLTLFFKCHLVLLHVVNEYSTFYSLP